MILHWRRVLAACSLVLGLPWLAAGETFDFDGPSPRIVNGLTTQDFPTTGALLIGGNPATASSHCTGTLIGCETFLTAAHCVEEDLDPAHYTVFLQHGGTYPVSSIAVPAEYFFPVADVAVLKLGSQVTGIRPSPIDVSGGHALGTTATIVGFGRTGGGTYDYGIKRYGEVSLANCQFGVSNQTSICWDFDSPLGAPGDDSNTCNADSGGPLFIDTGSGPIVAGITSGGNSNNCLPYDNSFDTRVSSYASYIQSEGGGDLTNTSCGSIPQIGDPDVEVFSFEGSLGGGNPQSLHSFSVDPGSLLLRVVLNANDDALSDFDIYVRAGALPTTSVYDCASTGSNQFGSCQFNNPASGAWHVLVDRFRGAGAYQLTVTSFGTYCSNPGNEGLSCDDENACTTGDVCQSGACIGTLVPDGTGCDDGNVCSQSDSCQAGVCIGQSTCGDGVIQSTCEQCDDGDTAGGDGCDASCAVEPCYVCDQEPSECGMPSGCAAAGRSILLIKDKPGVAGDRLTWKWLRGSTSTEAFGDPTVDDGFDLCVWDDGELVASAGVAQGGQCGGQPCWRALGSMIAPSGYRFKDSDSNSDGVAKVVMKAGSGKGKMVWKARGSNLGLPGPAGPTEYVGSGTLTVQTLRNDGAQCWESQFSGTQIRTNDPEKLKAVR